MTTSSPFNDANPTNKARFVPAVQQVREYKSFDNKDIEVNDIVYQISMLENSYSPILFKYTVTERLPDGRIKISGSYKLNDTVNNKINITTPNTVHTNPVELLQAWIVGVKHKLEIELPEMLRSLEKELKQIADISVENIQVGEGLNERLEI
jgi:UTP:GlnB (protein PII) uridylyltransferase